MSNDEHLYFSGKTPIEKQHAHEHNTLQILQRLASDGRRDEFFKLLETIQHEDKRKDIIQMCGMI